MKWARAGVRAGRAPPRGRLHEAHRLRSGMSGAAVNVNIPPAAIFFHHGPHFLMGPFGKRRERAPLHICLGTLRAAPSAVMVGSASAPAPAGRPCRVQLTACLPSPSGTAHAGGHASPVGSYIGQLAPTEGARATPCGGGAGALGTRAAPRRVDVRSRGFRAGDQAAGWRMRRARCEPAPQPPRMGEALVIQALPVLGPW